MLPLPSSDGYPESEHGVGALLDKFCDAIKSGRIRSDVVQSAGWLILMTVIDDQFLPVDFTAPIPDSLKSYAWKASGIEITDSIHEDIDYCYIVDMTNGEWSYTSSVGNTNIQRLIANYNYDTKKVDKSTFKKLKNGERKASPESEYAEILSIDDAGYGVAWLPQTHERVSFSPRDYPSDDVPTPGSEPLVSAYRGVEGTFIQFLPRED